MIGSREVWCCSGEKGMESSSVLDWGSETRVLEFSYSVMTLGVALEIADGWKYPPPYDFYDLTADPDDYDEFVTPERWPDAFVQVRSGGELVGFLSAEPVVGESAVEIGLGMRPDLTGGGLGVSFVRSNLAWVERNLPGREIRLSVACFNERAIAVYRRCGFRSVRLYKQATNGGFYDFVEMKYEP
ncbi:ribosomal-protein-alanine N-acetyltransferase [Actinomyces ruminicola]|uniref:Ribosomal-protein-alanine N-acetyltransferase n=1 Tax=Actinomyces ruminicola TaxID=332524 RepID=A0A1G9ZDM5_9ACTO|nr:GNAT family protein [Actinomyces ruminicola]SDN19061.1 ribosomal-protein-alanine N-acetyltransferase [Actinomyces ruminicola]